MRSSLHGTVGLLACLALAGPATAQTVAVEVVNPAGEPVEARHIALRGVGTIRERARVNEELKDTMRAPEETPASTAQLPAGPGVSGVVAWTDQGVVWAQVDAKAGEPTPLRLVVEPAGSVVVKHASPKKPKERPRDHTLDAALYRDGFCWGAVEFAVTNDARSGTIDVVQPGTYTLVATSVGARFTFVKQGVRVQSGRPVEVTIPEDGGPLGGYHYLPVDGKTNPRVGLGTAHLLLADQPVALNAVTVSGVQDDEAFVGWEKLTPGRYRLHLALPGYEVVEQAASVAKPRLRDSAFGPEETYPRSMIKLTAKKE